MPHPPTHNRLIPLAAYFASAFMLHLIWEVMHMPLFESGEAPFLSTFWMCLEATATGDMLFMLTLFLTISIIHKDLWWLSDSTTYLHPATWIIQVIVGILLAVSFELWAVYVVNRLVFASMPVLPIIGVGLTPLLQMTLIPIASTLFSWMMLKRRT